MATRVPNASIVNTSWAPSAVVKCCASAAASRLGM
jgi:hypothetical protein